MEGQPEMGDFWELENMNIYEPGLKKKKKNKKENKTPLRNLDACEHPPGKRRPPGSKWWELARSCHAHCGALPGLWVQLGKDVTAADSVPGIWGISGHKAKVPQA